MYVALPFALLLAGAGGLLVVAAGQPITDGPKLLSQPRHPVTPEMWSKTVSMAGLASPDFKVKDTDGTWHTLASLTEGKPLFLYFVLEGCPCSIDSEPLFERLYQHHGGKVSFLAVTSGNHEVAKNWRAEWACPYPVVAMPGKELMREFAVGRSVYSVLIDADGQIARMWPGYSASMLTEANELMAKLTKRPARPFDPKYAPKEMTSGCEF